MVKEAGKFYIPPVSPVLDHFVQAVNINRHPVLLTTVHSHVINYKFTVFLLRLSVNIEGIQAYLYNVPQM